MTLALSANTDLIKQVNYALVYRLIDQQGPISRIKLSEVSQLAPASITKVSRHLIELGLIQEAEQQASTGGRKAVSLVTVNDQHHFISVRLGQTSLHFSVRNLAGVELDQRYIPIQIEHQSQVIDFLLEQLGLFLAECRARYAKVIALALTMPGLINPATGIVIYTPKHPIRDLPLKNLLEKQFSLPCFIGNDIRAQVLAEHYFGEARDCLDALLISVHHGTGSGILANGQIFIGSNRNVGEIGHIQIDPLGKRCHCGNFGCLETIASNEAIVDKVIKLIQRGHNTLLQEPISIESICEAALKGDELASSVLEGVGDYLGRAIAIMVNLFNPQKVLLTGEITAAAPILVTAIRRCVEHQSLPAFHRSLPILPAHFQNDPTIGGVALIKQALCEGDLLQHIARLHQM